MQTSDEKWNEQMENFNLKLKRLKNDVLDYKKISQTHLNKNREAFIPGIKHDIKREFCVSNNNTHTNTNLHKNIHVHTEGGGGIFKIQKKRIGRCLLKDSEPNTSNKYIKSGNTQNGNYGSNQRQENKNVKFHFPLSKENTKKSIKTTHEQSEELNRKNEKNYIMRNKRKTERIEKTNEKPPTTVTIKQVDKEPLSLISLKDHTILNKKLKKTKLLYLEGEDGSIVVRQMYRDKDVGFHNITKMDDESLSKVKRENQDDDDIKTSKHLAEWSSDLVNKYILETIEKSKLHFLPLTVQMREEEMLQRLKN